VRVPLTWTDGAGVTVTKTFVFRRGQYRVGLEYKIENRSADAWQAASYAQILRDNVPIERSMFNVESYASSCVKVKKHSNISLRQTCVLLFQSHASTTAVNCNC
jgi:YidC/Oxa1 family membrane protein insertase